MSPHGSTGREFAPAVPLGVGVVRHAADGVIIGCDDMAAALLATTVEALLGQATLFPRLYVFDGSGRPAYPDTEPVWEIVREGRDAAARTLRFWRGDGSPAWIEVRSTLRAEGSGLGAVAAVSEIRDVSAQHAAAGSGAAPGTDMGGRLAGSVARVLNNLLTVILGHCQLLMRELPADDPRRPHAAAASRACELGSQLTGQLLAPGRGQLRHSPAQVHRPCAVLLAVCDPLLGDFAGQALAGAGCSVFEVSDRAEACAMADNTSFRMDVLVADLTPGASNRRELRLLLEHKRPTLRTLYLVGRGDSLSAFAAGAERETEVLVVPFESDELVTKVLALLPATVDASPEPG